MVIWGQFCLLSQALELGFDRQTLETALYLISSPCEHRNRDRRGWSLESQCAGWKASLNLGKAQ